MSLKKFLFIYLIQAGLLTNVLYAQDSTPWWNDTVFYEIFVRSFYDSNGDGIGDLQGLIQKLDYLNDGDSTTVIDLGITGIWLMPVSPSPSYHGYDVTDYRNIEEDYGALEDFKALVDSAHARGIKVIIDFVMNHSSVKHPWFTDSASSTSSPFREWYIWEKNNPGYNGTWGQPVWHFMNGAYYFGMFWSGMPDLNYRTEAVKIEMFDAVRFWLEEMNVDGFRLDAIKHLFEDGEVMEHVPETLDFFKEFRIFYKSVDPNAMAVGEVWSSTSEIAPYSDGTGIDFCFEFDISGSIIGAINKSQPDLISNKMDEVLNSYPSLQYAPFLSNHDNNRVFEQLSQDVNKMKLAAAIYLTLPGVPFIYYGEEIGMIGSGPDENKRTPMQWTGGTNAGFTSGSPWYSVQANSGNQNVMDLQSDENSLWHRYRKLISLRNSHQPLRTGDYVPVSSNDSELLSYARRTDEEIVVVVHNFRNNTVRNPILTLSSSNLHAGNYYVTSGMTGGNIIGNVSIDNSGGFMKWQPQMDIRSKRTAILHVDPSIKTSVASVTFDVTLPNSTPVNSDIYFAGTFNFWDPGPDQTGTDGNDHDLLMTSIGENHYQITLTLNTGQLKMRSKK